MGRGILQVLGEMKRQLHAVEKQNNVTITKKKFRKPSAHGGT